MGRWRCRMNQVYFSRVELKPDITVRTLAPLLLGRSDSTHPGHHLMWSLFAAEPDRRRDFLWREIESGVFFVLSPRPPEDRHGLFDVSPPKIFDPQLGEGDTLQFSLRANPVVRKRGQTGARSRKHDVVMDALHGVGTNQRAASRLSAVQDRGFAWLRRQGDRTGFSVAPSTVRVDGYEQHRVARKGARTMSFSTLDFEGFLTVVTPDSFIKAVAGGFGSAKAYGCGLMLIRRANRTA